ncbi:MAG TPA: hypothetical protein VFH43_09690 [Candidatus Kapabacteria bacterium]|jgi:hypothetical protein|nr:hypothetical protein [Candidatus Kapabacteria bacterium]
MRRLVVKINYLSGTLEDAAPELLVTLVDIPGTIEVKREPQFPLLHELTHLIDVVIANIKGRELSSLCLALDRRCKWSVMFPGPCDGEVVLQKMREL